MKKILSELDYLESPYHKSVGDLKRPETAHLFRVASLAGVSSVYLFETNSSQNDKHNLPLRPAVYIAEAKTPEQAREIHQSLWNLNFAPFIVIKLPHEIRVYTGFSYSEDEDDGWLETVPSNKLNQIAAILRDLSAASIDSGLIWKSRLGKKLNVNRRVDQRLLKNLRDLGNALESEIPTNIAHAIIGKYVYIMYLRHRGILTNEWLIGKGLNPDKVFSPKATIQSLQEVTNALEQQFNGKVFPLAFEKAQENGLADRHVSWVASVFSGAEITGDVPEKILRLQLHLPFRAYKFDFIPVETLSAIYEQFIDKRKEKGAIYTPEYLADYVLSEIESVKPIHSDGKILDPACGSGVFLVLAYRRLIEKEMLKEGKDLEPKRLKQILLNCIYGVERELEACLITEFSLILTLLHYIDPPHLHRLTKFKFPNLLDSQIFHTDFFDIDDEKHKSTFWSKKRTFDWIVGNPPWASKLDKELDDLARNWIDTSSYPIARYRVAEAFSWLATELLTEKGIVGFLLPATNLFNKNSTAYRAGFFQRNIIHKMTNFANMRNILFGKGKEGVLPAVSIIYQPTSLVPPDHTIVHYAPFVANQLIQDYTQPWTLTINANEISSIKQWEAVDGNSVVWKLGLWGSFADRNVLQRINYNFPLTINSLCACHSWIVNEASQLRRKDSKEAIVHIPELLGISRLDKQKINQLCNRFSVPPEAMEEIGEEYCYVRKQGGLRGIATTWSPHIYISPRAMDIILYSNEEFVIPSRNIGISAHENPKSALHLKALATYLNSSLVSYWLFFNVPQWGVFHQMSRRIITSTVGAIPVPEFDDAQVQILATHYDKLARVEKAAVNQLSRRIYNRRSRTLFAGDEAKNISIGFSSLSLKEQHQVKNEIRQLQNEWLAELDKIVYDVIGIPDDMRIAIDDFLYVRLPLDDRSTSKNATNAPSKDELKAYAIQLQSELNEFVMGRAIHDINITISNDLVECAIESNPSAEVTLGSINVSESVGLSKMKLMATFSKHLREQVSQWVYIQRGLRVYDNNRIFLYKNPRRIDWTRTQAILDAQDIISHILTTSESTREEHISIA